MAAIEIVLKLDGELADALKSLANRLEEIERRLTTIEATVSVEDWTDFERSGET